MLRCHAVIDRQHAVLIDLTIADSEIPVRIPDLCNITAAVKLQHNLSIVGSLRREKLHFKLSHMNRQIQVLIRAVPWRLDQIFAKCSVLNLWSQHFLGSKETNHISDNLSFYAHASSFVL